MRGRKRDPPCVMQARASAEGIIAAVSLMAKSGLPCYGRGQPLDNLKKRFHLEMNDAQAAAFMRKTIHDAYDKVLLALPFCGSEDDTQTGQHAQERMQSLCHGPAQAALPDASLTASG